MLNELKKPHGKIKTFHIPKSATTGVILNQRAYNNLLFCFVMEQEMFPIEDERGEEEAHVRVSAH